MTQNPLIMELSGDLFGMAPDNAVLVHACNTKGEWGAGIARAFRDRFGAAYRIYNTHCTTSDRSTLLGTTLLIPPQPTDHAKPGRRRYWIACLFTSHDYGRRKGSPESIIAATRTALEDLKGQLVTLGGPVDGERKTSGQQGAGETEKPGEVWACRFNSKNFGVPWARSRKVVEEVGLGMVVVELPLA